LPDLFSTFGLKEQGMGEPKSRTLRLDDLDLYVETYGEGEPLLLLHGFTGSGQDWVYAGRDRLAERFKLIIIDARGHGRSTNPSCKLTHRQSAHDTVAVLDALNIETCKAIGMSFGGNVLLHLAALNPSRIESMVIVSATPYFPEQARKLMGAVPPESQSKESWAGMRERHKLGDEQIRALFEQQYAFKDSYDDMDFTPATLAKISTPTLIVQGDRDPLYPLELSVEMYRALPRAALCVVPSAGHGPIFANHTDVFVHHALQFLSASSL
jgi:pimeloyl-ACP methyl ester carboxylesterase